MRRFSRAHVIEVSLRPVLTSGTVAAAAMKRTAGPALAGSSAMFDAVERAVVELAAGDAPVVPCDRVHARMQERLVVLIRLLQVLRGHEEPLGPDWLARVDHVAGTVLPEFLPSLTGDLRPNFL